MSNYATKKQLEHVTGVGKSNLAAKSDFPLEAEVLKVDMNKLVSVPTGLRDVKTILDDLDVGSLKTALIDLQKLINVMSKEVITNKI